MTDIGKVVFNEKVADSDLLKRIEALENTVKEVELVNSGIISDYEQLLTICHTLKIKYQKLKETVEGTRISRIIA